MSSPSTSPDALYAPWAADLAPLLADTLTRCADGTGTDLQDVQVLRQVCSLLDGEADLLRFPDTGTVKSVHGGTAFWGLLERAGREVGPANLTPASLAEALRAVVDDDPVEAARLVPLLKRAADLACPPRPPRLWLAGQAGRSRVGVDPLVGQDS